MGIFGFLKRQLLKVIQMEDMPANQIIKKYQLTDRDEIMNSSTLIVRPGQIAVFVHKGEICDVFGEGSYKLACENIPVLTKILSLPTGFDSPIKAEVYYVNAKQIAGLKWGTQNPIMMRDAEFGNVRIRGYGVYAFRVDDAKTFMRELAGVSDCFVSNIEGQLKPMILESLTTTISKSQISALDLAENYREFSKQVMEIAAQDMSKFGIEITSIVIENISVPEEVEKALDERTRLGILKDQVGTYTQIKAADALGDAAKNEGGGNLAGLGIGLGAGATMGQVFASAMGDSIKQSKESGKAMAESAGEEIICPHCNAKLSKKQKFCPECGNKLAPTCPKCGAEIAKNAKFCPECGEKLVKTCAKCGAELSSGVKFCPECGEKC